MLDKEVAIYVLNIVKYQSNHSNACFRKIIRHVSAIFRYLVKLITKKSASQWFIGSYHRAEEQWTHGVARGLLLYTGGALLSRLAMLIISLFDEGLKILSHSTTLNRQWIATEHNINGVVERLQLPMFVDAMMWKYIHDDPIFL